MEMVVEKLDDINHTLDKMLAVMQRPENRFIRLFYVAVHEKTPITESKDAV